LDQGSSWVFCRGCDNEDLEKRVNLPEDGFNITFQFEVEVLAGEDHRNAWHPGFGPKVQVAANILIVANSIEDSDQSLD
jgi:hypothetical protein